MKKNALTRSCSIFMVCLIGCGGGSQGTGVYDSGLPRGKDIRTLSPEDRAQICLTFDAAQKNIVNEDRLCTIAGVYGAVDPETSISSDPEKRCQIGKQVCIDHYDEIAPSPDDMPACPLGDSQPFDCSESASVDLLNACLGDVLDNAMANIASIQCSDAGNFSTSEEVDLYLTPVEEVPQTQSCLELQHLCPKLFE